MKRYKNPDVNLKLAYPKVMARSVGIAFLFLLALAVMFPSFEIDTAARVHTHDPVICVLPPPVMRPRLPQPERPAVPVEAETDEVPEDVTIELTELDLDQCSRGAVAAGAPRDRARRGGSPGILAG